MPARQVAHPARFLAAQLAEGKIAGLVQGRLETGPRALGNRSILASPLVPDVAARLNAAVKFREPFRPFAPVVLTDHAAGYFDLAQPSPFMSVAVPVTGLARDTIPAVVHANGTARVQALDPEHNPFLADVLACFAALTGVPVLINTSLNVKGKPISGTPQMALDCLAASGLDGLMLSAVDVKSARQAFADPCPWLVRGRGPRPWPSVQSRRSRAPLPGPDSRPLCVRGSPDATAPADTRRHTTGQSENSPLAKKIQLAGRFRRWWQVLGSNQRRLSRRFYSLSLLPEVDPLTSAYALRGEFLGRRRLLCVCGRYRADWNRSGRRARAGSRA